MTFFELLQVVCVGFFLCVVVAQTVRLRVRRRMNPIALSVERKGLLGVMEVALLVAVNVWIGLVLLYVLPLESQPLSWAFGPRLIDGSASQIAGTVLVLAGFGLQIAAMRSLGDSWRLGIDPRTPGPLITTGVYAVTRNPIYLFFDLYFIGTFLLNGALVFLIFTVLVMANLHYQIVEEERFLTRVHGAAYARYRQRVGRYITFRWARQVARRWARSPVRD